MSDRPNVLIFMTDQQQAQVVAPDHPCRTPHADQLARQGVRFTNVFTPAAHCCPSRASFHTGLYPSRHGIFNNVLTPTAINHSLPADVTCFSRPLRQGGYRLAYSGKWHVSRTQGPADYGWDEVYVNAGKSPGFDHHNRIEQWRRQPAAADAAQARPAGCVRRPGWGDYRLYGVSEDLGRGGYDDDPDTRTVRKAAAALPGIARSGQPWAMFVGTTGPHDPFIAPRRFARMYHPADVPLPESYRDQLQDKPRIYQRMRRQYWSQLTEDEVRASIAHYWAYCTMMDSLLGEMLEALETTGQAENTLVLFLSDHGEYCGAHGLYCKGVPAFREGYHIPCVARWPRGIARPGRVCDQLVDLTDFAPTFCDVAGVPALPNAGGRSLLPILRGQNPADWRDALFTQFNGVELYYSQRSVRTRDYKYVYNGFDFDELYDLRSDPHEMRNLADEPACEEIKHDMVRRMWRFAAQQQDERLFNAYATVAMAPWGPADALRD